MWNNGINAQDEREIILVTAFDQSHLLVDLLAFRALKPLLQKEEHVIKQESSEMNRLLRHCGDQTLTEKGTSGDIKEVNVLLLQLIVKGLLNLLHPGSLASFVGLVAHRLPDVLDMLEH